MIEFVIWAALIAYPLWRLRHVSRRKADRDDSRHLF